MNTSAIIGIIFSVIAASLLAPIVVKKLMRNKKKDGHRNN
jgi:hypothetical protein